MPELPEVQTIVTGLSSRLIGKTIRGVVLARTDIVTPPTANLRALLSRRVISGMGRRGKRIVFTLDNGTRFYIHLGMSGRLSLHPAGMPPANHTHLQLDFGTERLHFRDPRRFGGIWWLGREPDDETRMGPEPLTLRPRQLAARLARTGRAIKNALLDQRVVAGLGNIYVDESLFAAGIHPLTSARDLSYAQVQSLNRAIKRTLRRALRHRGSTFRDYRDAEGAAGGFQSLHRVYGREGAACAVCRGVIQRVVLGGRSTHFCPACQPGASARSASPQK